MLCRSFAVSQLKRQAEKSRFVVAFSPRHTHFASAPLHKGLSGIPPVRATRGLNFGHQHTLQYCSLTNATTKTFPVARTKRLNLNSIQYDQHHFQQLRQTSSLFTNRLVGLGGKSSLLNGKNLMLYQNPSLNTSLDGISSSMRNRTGFGGGLLLPKHNYLSHQLGAVTYFSSWPGGGNRPGGGSRWAQGIGLLGAASVLFGKTKYVLAALKLTKLASLGSMVLTIGTYSMFFGLPYAVGMVGLITVHEAGHALVMLQRGIPFSPMVFIPFIGASVAMNRMPRDAWEDALVGLGGPALGSLGAAAVAVAGHSTDSQLLYALADFGFMINLFNLFPLGMMDGGRITGALSPYAGVVGVGLGGYLAYQGVIHNPIFYLILLMGTYETGMRFYDPYRSPPNYYKITSAQRAVLTGSYFGLIVALLTAMSLNHRFQKPPEVLIREREMERSWDYR